MDMMQKQQNTQSLESSSNTSIYIMRHAESEANVANLIVSDPAVGVESYGLTDKGKEQTREACLQLESVILANHTAEDDHLNLSEKLIIVSSDFTRTRETAEILHDHFKVKTPLQLETALRERNFGDFNMTDSSNYHKVWEKDATDGNHTCYGCESVMSVFTRASKLIKRMNDEHQGKIVVLVSHGDTSQISLTLAAGIAPNQHRTLPHLENCEIRPV